MVAWRILIITIPPITTPRRTIIIGRTTRIRIGHRLYTPIPAGSIFTRIYTWISASAAVVIHIMADAGIDKRQVPGQDLLGKTQWVPASYAADLGSGNVIAGYSDFLTW